MLVYVTVRSAALNVARVRTRFAQGGHAVPNERIRARRERSHRMFAWFARHASMAVVFDNSRPSPVVAAVKGPAGWLERRFGGMATAPADQPEWMLLQLDLLAPGLAAMIRSLAARQTTPDD